LLFNTKEYVTKKQVELLQLLTQQSILAAPTIAKKEGVHRQFIINIAKIVCYTITNNKVKVSTKVICSLHYYKQINDIYLRR